MKIPLPSRNQRNIQINDESLNAYYKIAQAHATEEGRTEIYYRDFYLGHWDELVEDEENTNKNLTLSGMKRARAHFRQARGLAEGPDPKLIRPFCQKLRRDGITWSNRGWRVKLPKRFRKI